MKWLAGRLGTTVLLAIIVPLMALLMAGLVLVAGVQAIGAAWR
jgi:hypothetical protein